MQMIMNIMNPTFDVCYAMIMTFNNVCIFQCQVYVKKKTFFLNTYQLLKLSNQLWHYIDVHYSCIDFHTPHHNKDTYTSLYSGVQSIQDGTLPAVLKTQIISEQRVNLCFIFSV